MGRDHRRRPQTKRRFRQIESRGEHEFETVDDLAHAAQFAIFPTAAVATSPLIESGDAIKKEEDDNEIEVGDDDDDSDASITDAAPNHVDDKHDNDDDDESDDNESDDDLAEAIQRMEKATAEEESNPLAMASNPPKTKNEVDGYKVPIQELESQLQMKLTVQGGTKTAMAMNNNMDVTMNEVSLAGKIKNYLLLDRTVVVESITNSPSSRLQQQATGPLDEGSLLVIQKPDNTDDDKDAFKTIWIPLGRIFEVFGPVSQPLYTIRLPSPSLNEKKKSSAKRSSKNNSQKNNELKDHVQTRRGVVDSEEGEAKIGTHQDDNETTTVNIKESNEENAPRDTEEKTELSNEEGELITNGEKASDHEEKNYVIQSPSSRITIKETSENKDTPSDSLSLSSSSQIVKKSLPTQEKNDELEESVIDQWAIDGEYAKFLSQNKDIQVYYIQDEAKLIDTGLVLRASGKGCDASNIHDEEILDCIEAYYSDDEKEREAKNKKKGATRKRTQPRNNNKQEQQQSRPRDCHQQQMQHNASTRLSNAAAIGHHGRPTPPPPPPQGYGYDQHANSLPQGFHRTTQQNIPNGGFQQPSHLYQYPIKSSFHGQTSIPPPPPPKPNQPYQYQGAAPSTYLPQASTSMVPPPPPRNPNEPPAYQY